MTTSPTSAASSHSSGSSWRRSTNVYRHEPYAPTVIVPGSHFRVAVVSCRQRSPKSVTSSFAASSPAQSVSDIALPIIPAAPAAFFDTAAHLTPVVTRAATPAPVSTPSPAPAPTPLTHPAHVAVWVTFKYGRKPFMTTEPVCFGEPVVVEGDRGIDFGIVDSACTGPQPASVPSILRRATAADTAQHYRRMAEERDALQTMRTLAAQVRCPAHIEDVMRQLDGKKITVIISRTSRSFVDFRRLQRALFDVYHCRIWFAYLDEIIETMSTDVTQALNRNQRRCSTVNQTANKKTRASATAI